MTNKQKKANVYAEQVAGTILHDMIKKAFLEGYKEGFQDGEENATQSPDMEEFQNSVSFIDLNLPSGTLWSDDYVRDKRGNIIYMSAEEAAQYNIPTLEQLNEFLKSLVSEDTYDYDKTYGIPEYHSHIRLIQTRFSAKNSYIIFNRNGCYNNKNEFSLNSGFYFWLRVKDEVAVQYKIPKTNYLKHNEKKESKYEYSVKHLGYRYPVRLVKNKNS